MSRTSTDWTLHVTSKPAVYAAANLRHVLIEHIVLKRAAGTHIETIIVLSTHWTVVEKAVATAIFETDVTNQRGPESVTIEIN